MRSRIKSNLFLQISVSFFFQTLNLKYFESCPHSDLRHKYPNGAKKKKKFAEQDNVRKLHKFAIDKKNSTRMPFKLYIYVWVLTFDFLRWVQFPLLGLKHSSLENVNKNVHMQNNEKEIITFCHRENRKNMSQLKQEMSLNHYFINIWGDWGRICNQTA